MARLRGDQATLSLAVSLVPGIVTLLGKDMCITHKPTGLGELFYDGTINII